MKCPHPQWVFHCGWSLQSHLIELIYFRFQHIIICVTSAFTCFSQTDLSSYKILLAAREGLTLYLSDIDRRKATGYRRIIKIIFNQNKAAELTAAISADAAVAIKNRGKELLHSPPPDCKSIILNKNR